MHGRFTTMSKDNQLFWLMQIFGGGFPAGGFSQSWSLETYVAQERITSENEFLDFLITYLDSVIGRNEGPIFREAYGIAIAKKGDITKISELEELSRAMKVARENRESSLRMGKALLRIMAEVTEDRGIRRVQSIYEVKGMTYPAACGVVCGRLGLDLRGSIGAFVFSSVSSLVQSGVKLIPLGNTQAQGLLLRVHPFMEKAAGESMRRPVCEISNFSPGFDIAGIMHETLAVRLYMS